MHLWCDVVTSAPPFVFSEVNPELWLLLICVYFAHNIYTVASWKFPSCWLKFRGALNFNLWGNYLLVGKNFLENAPAGREFFTIHFRNMTGVSRTRLYPSGFMQTE